MFNWNVFDKESNINDILKSLDSNYNLGIKIEQIFLEKACFFVFKNHRLRE
jgi:hypothetical protein